MGKYMLVFDSQYEYNMNKISCSGKKLAVCHRRR